MILVRTFCKEINHENLKPDGIAKMKDTKMRKILQFANDWDPKVAVNQKTVEHIYPISGQVIGKAYNKIVFNCDNQQPL